MDLGSQVEKRTRGAREQGARVRLGTFFGASSYTHTEQGTAGGLVAAVVSVAVCCDCWPSPLEGPFELNILTGVWY
jgi:hypothetical protein